MLGLTGLTSKLRVISSISLRKTLDTRWPKGSIETILDGSYHAGLGGIDTILLRSVRSVPIPCYWTSLKYNMKQMRTKKTRSDATEKDPLFKHPVRAVVNTHGLVTQSNVLSYHHFIRTWRFVDRHICGLQLIMNRKKSRSSRATTRDKNELYSANSQSVHVVPPSYAVYQPHKSPFPVRCSWIQPSALNHLRVSLSSPKASLGHFFRHTDSQSWGTRPSSRTLQYSRSVKWLGSVDL